jgi:hypothetical protein
VCVCVCVCVTDRQTERARETKTPSTHRAAHLDAGPVDANGLRREREKHLCATHPHARRRIYPWSAGGEGLKR